MSVSTQERAQRIDVDHTATRALLDEVPAVKRAADAATTTRAALEAAYKTAQDTERTAHKRYESYVRSIASIHGVERYDGSFHYDHRLTEAVVAAALAAHRGEPLPVTVEEELPF